MDPEAALKAAEFSIQQIGKLLKGSPGEAQGRALEAEEYLDNYFGWRARGGFQPPKGDSRAKALLKKLHKTFDHDELVELRAIREELDVRWKDAENALGLSGIDDMERNPVVTISPKQWRGYFAMHKEPWGPSSNDGYNIDKYGITSEQYRSLLKIAEGAAGMDAKSVTQAQIKKLLSGDKVMLSRADPRDIDRVTRAFGPKGQSSNPGPQSPSLKRKLMR